MITTGENQYKSVLFLTWEYPGWVFMMDQGADCYDEFIVPQ